MKREDLEPWILEALKELGGEGSVVDVARAIWEKHEADLRSSGEMFYKWQYELRHAGTSLVSAKKITKSDRWRLTR